MSFIKDSIREALNESLELKVIGQFGNKTLLLADEFDGRTYMVMDGYIDEDHPGKHDRSFISKDEAIHYLMSNNVNEDAKCDRCGAPIEGDGFASKENPSGILCDACYHDMYGVNEGLENNGPNNTKWKDIDGDWYPETYADGYESLKGLDIPQDVLDYMDKWFGFEVIVGQTPDGQIMFSDEDGNYELYDTVENFVADMKYSMEQTQDLDESVIPATDVVVRNASGELSRQAVSSTEELGKYLMSMVDALEAGDTISLETIDFMESLNKLVESLNEDVDSEDNALIRSAYRKIDGKQSNMRLLTPEEKDALERNGIDAWAWGKETKMVSPNNNDIINGRRRDRYYYDRNGHPKRNQDPMKMDLADRAAKLDARDANQDIKGYRDGKYQDQNREYDADQISKPVHKMKNALRRRNDAQDELNNAEADFREREFRNLSKFSKDASDIELKHGGVKRDLEQRIDNDNAKIQALLDKHKRESLELIEDYLLKLNEAEMSDEDKRDNELIRSAQMKLAGRRNARLSDEEQDALKRHNLVPSSNYLVMGNGYGYLLDTRNPKANLAGMADKRPGRIKYNNELADAPYTDAADRNVKNYSDSSRWNRTRQDNERAADAARMGKDYDEMDKLIRDRRYLKKEIADNDAQREKNWNDAVQKRDAETTRNKARLMRIKDENPAKIAAAQGEIDSLLRKNESLNESVEGRVIHTGLENIKVNNEILRSVIGQMSDGLWENSPGMDKYWYPLDIDGTDIVIDNSKYHTYDGMSDSEIKRFFANKIKRIAQEFLNDNNMNPFNGFRKDNETPCNYLNYEETITIGDAYKAYEKLK